MKLTKSVKTTLKLLIGIGLLALAVIPTPDDVFIVFPVAQLISGLVLVIQYIIDTLG